MDVSKTDVNMDDEMVEVDAENFPFDPSIERQRQFSNFMERSEEEERTKFFNKMKMMS